MIIDTKLQSSYEEFLEINKFLIYAKSCLGLYSDAKQDYLKGYNWLRRLTMNNTLK